MVDKKFKAVKITNQAWLVEIAPFLNSFLDKVEIPGVTWDSFSVYLKQIAQFGMMNKQNNVERDLSELWCVFEDGKPIAFACWYVSPLPLLGTVYCPFCYSWQTKKIPVKMLAEEFIRYGQAMRAKYYKFDATNERVYEVLKSTLEELGLEVNRTPTVHAWCVKGTKDE